jgi:hypothetical protein
VWQRGCGSGSGLMTVGIDSGSVAVWQCGSGWVAVGLTVAVFGSADVAVGDI